MADGSAAITGAAVEAFMPSVEPQGRGAPCIIAMTEPMAGVVDG